MSTRGALEALPCKVSARARLTHLTPSILALALVLALSLELGLSSIAKAETFTAPPLDSYPRWEMGYRERFEGFYGTNHVVGRSWGYSFYYDGEIREIPCGTILGSALRGVKGGVVIRVFGYEEDFWTYTGFYTPEPIYISGDTAYVKVKASIKAVQDFLAKPTYLFSYPYWARADVYFQVCLVKIIVEYEYDPESGLPYTKVTYEGLPQPMSWEAASVGYLQRLFTLRVYEKVSAGTTWTPEIKIDVKKDNIESGYYYVYFGILAHSDRELSIYEASCFDTTPIWYRNDCAFQFQSVEISTLQSLTVKDPKVVLCFNSPTDWRLEDEESTIKVLPKGWTEPSDPSSPSKMAFGDFTKPDLYVEVQGSPGEEMTVTVAFPREYFWTIDPNDPFNRAKYTEGGNFTATKKLTEDDLNNGWVRFTSDKVFRAKPLQGIDYVDVPITITISYSGTSKTFTAYIRLASIKPEVRQVWLSPSFYVIRVYGLWCDDNTNVKNRPYLYYGLDLESKRLFLKTGIDSNGNSYAESDLIDPQTLRPTGYSVDKQSLIPVTPATDEFTLKSGYVEYRELALSVLQRDSSKLRLRVYEFKAPNYSPVPSAKVSLIVKDLTTGKITEYVQTAGQDGCVEFSRSGLSLPASNYELWAIAWGSDSIGVIYGRSPFGCILLEKA
jgi:hypothetical protein